jgi:hypothetical protein
MNIQNQRVAARQVFEEQMNQMADDQLEACAQADYAMPPEIQQQKESPSKLAANQQKESPSKLAANLVQAYASPANLPLPPPQTKKQIVPVSGQKTSEELQLEKGALQVRESGWWWWRTVVVPPNAYVVQTRRGRKDPVTLGLGISFRYRPRTDSYFVVPAALQTIGIVARGVSREKQGINILAYVQWLINDFSLAYRRLDFSDIKDPMAIVNAQLREQAEAAIKDKIATMTVEEILTDKAPIIEELTQRMKAVAEGNSQGDRLSGMGGLGVQIVTVQIKEAYVSSSRLWEFLQAPFRNEREREARLSRLKIEEEIRQQELTNKRQVETSESQTQSEIEKFQAEQESNAFEVVVRERLRRQKLETEENQRAITFEEETELARRISQKKLEENGLQTEHEMALLRMKQEQETSVSKARLEAEGSLQQKEIAIQTRLQELQLEEKLHEYENQLKLKELESKRKLQDGEYQLAHQELESRLRLKAVEQEEQLKVEEKTFQATILHDEERHRILNAQKEQEILQDRSRQEILNSTSPNDLSRRLVQALPDVVKAMPQIKELRRYKYRVGLRMGSP